MYKKDVGLWLLVMTGMVFATVILGGLTRLTGSGLSMVDWQPITGWLPPLNDDQWQSVFDLYKQTPQYHDVNFDMTVDGFKSIFWLEYVHRVWGRLIGVVFIVPFAYFTLRGRISGALAPRIFMLFVLGALQGAVGWFMVASGLVDVPQVSQYALVAHLGTALLIYVYMLWQGLTLVRPDGTAPVAKAHRPLARATSVLILWIALTMLAGGFVAGTHAGLIYNTFPLMNGDVLPQGAFGRILAPFEDPGTIQFDHRLLAEAAFVFILVLWVGARKQLPSGKARTVYDLLAVMGLVQVGLGIGTLLLAVPVDLAAAHQAGAFLLMTLAVMARHSLRGAPEMPQNDSQLAGITTKSGL